MKTVLKKELKSRPKQAFFSRQKGDDRRNKRKASPFFLSLPVYLPCIAPCIAVLSLRSGLNVLCESKVK